MLGCVVLMLGCVVLMLGCVVLASQCFSNVSDPDSGFTSRVGYVGVVCGDQKYSNTVSEPTEYVLSLLSTDAPRYRTKTSPDQQIWAFWSKSG